jgi:hypothetical protein
VVFDILASDGKRIRGGVRAIQLTDLETGQTLAVGSVKDSVKGLLLPPNQILYPDAFDGIEADVVLVWKHHIFSHDVILRERPLLPLDWDPAAVRLEVITEFLVDEQPELRFQMVRTEGQPELEDGVNSQGGYNNEPESSLRSAVQWLKIQTSPSVGISASGRIFDSASTNPNHYFFPSLMVNTQGDMVVGFAGSRQPSILELSIREFAPTGAHPVVRYSFRRVGIITTFIGGEITLIHLWIPPTA